MGQLRCGVRDSDRQQGEVFVTLADNLQRVVADLPGDQIGGAALGAENAADPHSPSETAKRIEPLRDQIHGLLLLLGHSAFIQALAQLVHKEDDPFQRSLRMRIVVFVNLGNIVLPQICEPAVLLFNKLPDDGKEFQVVRNQFGVTLPDRAVIDAALEIHQTDLVTLHDRSVAQRFHGNRFSRAGASVDDHVSDHGQIQEHGLKTVDSEGQLGIALFQVLVVPGNHLRPWAGMDCQVQFDLVAVPPFLDPDDTDVQGGLDLLLQLPEVGIRPPVGIKDPAFRLFALVLPPGDQDGRFIVPVQDPRDLFDLAHDPAKAPGLSELHDRKEEQHGQRDDDYPLIYLDQRWPELHFVDQIADPVIGQNFKHRQQNRDPGIAEIRENTAKPQTEKPEIVFLLTCPVLDEAFPIHNNQLLFLAQFVTVTRMAGVILSGHPLMPVPERIFLRRSQTRHGRKRS